MKQRSINTCTQNNENETMIYEIQTNGEQLLTQLPTSNVKEVDKSR